ncbi:MAG: cyclase family protein [Nocardioidaceae bacterium]|nr:cyclase family protein [Nocardioidaceae bacterium]
MSEDEFRSLYRRLRESVPWGPDDRRGALNYLTEAETLAAAGEVRWGRAVSLASPVAGRRTPDNPEPARHVMLGPPAVSGTGLAFGVDRIEMNIHGDADSHLDALCHVIFDGELYNGVPTTTLTEDGATELSVRTAADGLVGRGVLLDVSRSRGRPWLEPGDHVTVADLLAAERSQGVEVGSGDILLVRVGHRQRRNEQGPWDVAKARTGLHPEVVPFFSERQVAVLGNDGNGDTAPALTDGVDFPVHVLAIHALGLMLMDYLQLEDLLALCQQAGRWSFLCVIAPLRLSGATGSPVNPIAVL